MKTALSPLLTAFAAHRHTALRALLFAGLLALGRQEAYAGSYSNDFATGVGTATPGGSAALDAGQLRLTPDTSSTFGNLLLPDLDPGSAIQSFTLSFNLTIDAKGRGDGADGFSLNFANPASYPSQSTYYSYEDGAGSGLKFRFITYTVNKVVIDGMGEMPAFTNAIMTDGTKQPVTITYDKDTGITLTYRGQTFTATPAQVNATGFNPQAGFQFFFGARCGGGHEEHLIDDVVITTTPRPNSAPILADQTFAVDENTANETVVGTLAASDPDGHSLTYAITAGNTSGAFAIHATTGQITVANSSALDFETTPSFTLAVQVTDNGLPNLSASSSVTINLNNLNEASPVFTQVVEWEDIYLRIDPPPVPAGLSSVRAIAAGRYHSLALKTDSTVVQWGGHPAPGPSSSQRTAIAGGYGFSMAMIGYNGAVHVWGYDLKVPSVSPPAGYLAKAFAAGKDHSLFVSRGGVHWPEGTVHASSDNVTLRSVPAGLSNVTAVAAGLSHSLALKRDGTVVAWGSNGSGQTNVPAGLRGVTAIAAGDRHSMALKSDGTVVTWGRMTRLEHLTENSGVTAIAACGIKCMALKRDGTVVLWSPSGILPVPPGLNTVTAIATGEAQSLVLQGTGFSLSIPSTNGTVVGTVVATDADPGQSLTFAITSNPSGAWAIHPTTGQITVNDANALSGTRHTLTVQAMDNGSPSRSASTDVEIRLIPPTSLEFWRNSYFGSYANSGNGAATVDFDQDGMVNLLEYAFGLNPTLADSGQLPQPQLSGGNFIYDFTVPATTSDSMTYVAEWSTSLEPGSWNPVSGTEIFHPYDPLRAPRRWIFTVPTGSNERLFVRLRVSETFPTTSF